MRTRQTLPGFTAEPRQICFCLLRQGNVTHLVLRLARVRGLTDGHLTRSPGPAREQPRTGAALREAGRHIKFR
jgi:hypothetical protein